MIQFFSTFNGGWVLNLSPGGGTLPDRILIESHRLLGIIVHIAVCKRLHARFESIEISILNPGGARFGASNFGLYFLLFESFKKTCHS